MTRSEELRSKYPVFRYERFEIDKSSSRIVARFHFSIPPDITFTPEVHFEPTNDGWYSVPEEFFDNADSRRYPLETVSHMSTLSRRLNFAVAVATGGAK